MESEEMSAEGKKELVNALNGFADQATKDKDFLKVFRPEVSEKSKRMVAVTIAMGQIIKQQIPLPSFMTQGLRNKMLMSSAVDLGFTEDEMKSHLDVDIESYLTDEAKNAGHEHKPSKETCADCPSKETCKEAVK